MSSENLDITPKTFDSEVPPFKKRCSAKSQRKRIASSQQTQKSFSNTMGETLRRIAAWSI
jgi:hypothetical protein